MKMEFKPRGRVWVGLRALQRRGDPQLGWALNGRFTPSRLAGCALSSVAGEPTMLRHVGTPSYLRPAPHGVELEVPTEMVSPAWQTGKGCLWEEVAANNACDMGATAQNDFLAGTHRYNSLSSVSFLSSLIIVPD